MGVMAEPLAHTGLLTGGNSASRVSEQILLEFDAWVAREQRRIFLLCLRMMQDRDEADMAAQDCFVKAHRALRNSGTMELDDPSKWITRIAVNTCLDRLRSRSWKIWRRRPSHDDETIILANTKEASPSAESQAFAGQIGARLQAAIGELSERQRAVFLLRHYEDRKLEEIAEILGLDVGTVKAHMARAVAKLRTQLQDLYGELK
jgi:RNA polymerase sigma-70 factor (ECF subfamily)